MPVTDELEASAQIYGAALRAKAKEPLTVAKFVDLKRCSQDVHGGRVWNADALIGEVKAKHPELFEAPAVIKRPEPLNEDRSKDAFAMSESEFRETWSRRYPWAS
jgi:hypothetical protein